MEKSNKRLRIERNYKYVVDYLSSHPCVDCGERNPLVLEFDHLDDKHKNVSEMVRTGYSIKKINMEIEKCSVVCSNCHRLRTIRRANAYPYIYYMNKYVSV